MTSSNFSWGIGAFAFTIFTSIAAIVVLAALGYTDPVLFGGLVTLGTNALIALSATMNPNRKFQDEIELVKDATQQLKVEAQHTRNEGEQIKRMLQ